MAPRPGSPARTAAAGRDPTLIFDAAADGPMSSRIMRSSSAALDLPAGSENSSSTTQAQRYEQAVRSQREYQHRLDRFRRDRSHGSESEGAPASETMPATRPSGSHAAARIRTIRSPPDTPRPTPTAPDEAKGGPTSSQRQRDANLPPIPRSPQRYGSHVAHLGGAGPASPDGPLAGNAVPAGLDPSGLPLAGAPAGIASPAAPPYVPNPFSPLARGLQVNSAWGPALVGEVARAQAWVRQESSVSLSAKAEWPPSEPAAGPASLASPAGPIPAAKEAEATATAESSSALEAAMSTAPATSASASFSAPGSPNSQGAAAAMEESAGSMPNVDMPAEAGEDHGLVVSSPSQGTVASQQEEQAAPPRRSGLLRPAGSESPRLLRPAGSESPKGSHTESGRRALQSPSLRSDLHHSPQTASRPVSVAVDSRELRNVLSVMARHMSEDGGLADGWTPSDAKGYAARSAVMSFPALSLAAQTSQQASDDRSRALSRRFLAATVEEQDESDDGDADSVAV